MAEFEPPAAKRMNWSPAVNMDHGKRLSLERWPELEKRLRYEFSEGAFERAEVYFPNTFTSNRRPWSEEKLPTVTMQYLQHSTHSAEKDMIWKKEVAKLKGNTKKAALNIPIDGSYVRVTTWKQSLDENCFQQLRIKKCYGCRDEGHQCSGCCTSSANGSTCKWNHYIQLAELTCEPTGGTCTGEKCKKVEKVLPGSYVWFGIPDSKEDSPQLVIGKQQATKEEFEFKRYWKLESRYGMHSFVVDIHTLLQAYQESIKIDNGQASDCHGNVTPRIVLRCGGTLIYTKEVCYVVIVTYEGDEKHDKYPAVTDPGTDDAKYPPRCDWSPLLDANGCYTKRAGYPTFTPHHKKGERPYYWDHIVFAFHLPKGKELSLPKEALVGGGPLDTEHNTPDTQCHLFRRRNPAKECKDAEAQYTETQGNALQKKHAAK